MSSTKHPIHNLVALKLHCAPALNWVDTSRTSEKHTHPVGCADSLVVDAVAFLWQQGGVPVAVVGLVVAHGEWLWRVDACGGELSSEVVLRVQERGVLEVNGDRVAAQDFCRASCPAWTFLLHHHLVRTANMGHKQSEHTPTGQTDAFTGRDWQRWRFSLLANPLEKASLNEWQRNVP